MLKRYSEVFISFVSIFDLVLTSGAWLLAYYLRVILKVVPIQKGEPEFNIYSLALIVIIPISAIVYRYFGLYKPRREDRIIGEIFDIFRACVVAIIVLLGASFFYRRFEYSRIVVVFFFLVNFLFLTISRSFLRSILKSMRAKGKNLRYALVVGSGKLGQQVLEKIERDPWMGIRVVGFVDDNEAKIGKNIHGIPVLGKINQLPGFITEYKVDQIFCALPFNEHHRLEEVVNTLSEEMVDLKIVPDLLSFVTLNSSISELDGLPLIKLRESPLHGWGCVVKRIFDIVFSLCVIVPFLPIWLFISLLVKVTSPGPVFYKQERLGLDGHVFPIYKFRSMGVGAESKTGAVWAKENDPRRTRFGTFLRKSCLDEIPQFINVLKGDMSVVGPRPERPVFIEQFKKSIPKYMLRHKMKAGITGWAQVNGWRGDTDLEKRIQYDIFYIENWSFWFDIRIIIMTFFSLRKNAY